MELVMKPYYGLPCSLQEFIINGQEADADDFGHSEDVDKENAEPYGCGCRKFIIDDSNAEECMKKYNLTYEEYQQVCEQLEETLYVGQCGWCV